MNDKERTAPTQLPPAPETPSEAAAAVIATLPPPNGTPPDELAPDSDLTLRAASEHYASPAVERMSIERLVDMNGRVESYMRELLDPKGSFAASRVQTVTDVSLVVDNAMKAMRDAFVPRFEGIEAKLSKQGEMIHKLEVAYAELRDETNRKLAEFAWQIAALKEQRGAAGPEATAAT